MVITVRASGAVVKTVTGRPGALTSQQVSRLIFRDYHDADIDVGISERIPSQR